MNDVAQVAQEAKGLAHKALNKIEGHEELCAERYKNIHSTLNLIMRVLAWGGSSLIIVLITALGWLAVQQMSLLQHQSDLVEYATSHPQHTDSSAAPAPR